MNKRYNTSLLGRLEAGTVEQERIVRPALLRELRAVQGKSILDIGCGAGQYARLLAQRGARVTGLDRNANQLALARHQEEIQPLGIRYVQADVRYCRTLASSFDIALLMFVVLDLSSPATVRSVLMAATRALTAEGKLIIGDIHSHNFGRRNDVEDVTIKPPSDYFDNGAVASSTARLANGSLITFEPNYHYRLDFLLNSLNSVGLTLSRLVEAGFQTAFPTHMLIVATKR